MRDPLVDTSWTRRGIINISKGAPPTEFNSPRPALERLHPLPASTPTEPRAVTIAKAKQSLQRERLQEGKNPKSGSGSTTRKSLYTPSKRALSESPTPAPTCRRMPPSSIPLPSWFVKKESVDDSAETPISRSRSPPHRHSNTQSCRRRSPSLLRSLYRCSPSPQAARRTDIDHYSPPRRSRQRSPPNHQQPYSVASSSKRRLHTEVRIEMDDGFPATDLLRKLTPFKTAYNSTVPPVKLYFFELAHAECYSCGAKGHSFMDCVLKCGRCGGQGHKTIYCDYKDSVFL